jgi:hypothetical protein
LFSAFHKWISNGWWRTAADGAVVDDLTPSSIATHSWTRVNTLGVHTGLVSRTVRADYTFWAATTSSRIAKESR